MDTQQLAAEFAQCTEKWSRTKFLAEHYDEITTALTEWAQLAQEIARLRESDADRERWETLARARRQLLDEAEAVTAGYKAALERYGEHEDRCATVEHRRLAWREDKPVPNRVYDPRSVRERFLLAAMTELRAATYGHQHWDPTGSSGVGCERCQSQIAARRRAEILVGQAAAADDAQAAVLAEEP